MAAGPSSPLELARIVCALSAAMLFAIVVGSQYWIEFDVPWPQTNTSVAVGIGLVRGCVQIWTGGSLECETLSHGYGTICDQIAGLRGQHSTLSSMTPPSLLKCDYYRATLAFNVLAIVFMGLALLSTALWFKPSLRVHSYLLAPIMSALGASCGYICVFVWPAYFETTKDTVHADTIEPADIEYGWAYTGVVISTIIATFATLFAALAYRVVRKSGLSVPYTQLPAFPAPRASGVVLPVALPLV
eukprot:m.253460 g.253460  ORF g.253460 m.253460 type:complete len:245 (-) comp18387_c0_seq1:275-1009(-)